MIIAIRSLTRVRSAAAQFANPHPLIVAALFLAIAIGLAVPTRSLFGSGPVLLASQRTSKPNGTPSGARQIVPACRRTNRSGRSVLVQLVQLEKDKERFAFCQRYSDSNGSPAP
jgi:hypothetical protein